MADPPRPRALILRVRRFLARLVSGGPVPTNGIPLSTALLREVVMSGYLVDFRGFTACPCLAEWLPVYEAELQRRGVLAGALRIYQLVGGAAASAGTHSTGGAFDITDLTGDEDVWVARQMGADATWARTAAQGFTPHIHGVLRGCPHNGPAAYQIAAVDAGFNGLGSGGRGAPDDGPRPLSKRTWRQGIEWAREQGDDMPYTEKQLTDIVRGAVKAELDPLRTVLRNRDNRLRALIKRKFKATDADLDAIFAEVADEEPSP